MNSVGFETGRRLNEAFVDYHDPAEQISPGQGGRVRRSRFMAGGPDWNQPGVGRPYMPR